MFRFSSILRRKRYKLMQSQELRIDVTSLVVQTNLLFFAIEVFIHKEICCIITAYFLM